MSCATVLSAAFLAQLAIRKFLPRVEWAASAVLRGDAASGPRYRVTKGNASKGKAQGKGKAREQGMQGTASKAASAGSVGHAQPPPHAPPDHMVGPVVKRRKLLKDMRITLENCARGAERVADIAADFSEACREEAVNFGDASQALKEMEWER